MLAGLSADGLDVHFLTGTDEHGQKIARVAQDKGVTPQELADRNLAKLPRDLAKTLNISNDDFIRTTEPRHIAAFQALWKKLEDAGHIYLNKYSGWYAVRDEAYYDESELTKAQDGSRIAPTGAPVSQLKRRAISSTCPSGRTSCSHFMTPIRFAFGPKSRLNEVRSFVAGGLRDLSISRTTFSWGVPVPGNPRHVMYVSMMR